MSRTGGDEPSGIGDRLRASRQRMGWSREELAFRSDLSWSAIAQVESGRRRNLRPTTLSALADALGVTIDYLVRGAPVDSPMLDHRALLYDSDEEVIATVAPFLSEGIERSEAVLAVLTRAHVGLLREQLGREAKRVEFVEREDWYSAPGPAFQGLREFVSSRLAAGAPWCRIVGEPIRAGAPTEEARLWIRYESLVNLALAPSGATVLCPYDTRSVDPDVVSQARRAHPRTAGPGGVAASPGYVDPPGLMFE